METLKSNVRTSLNVLARRGVITPEQMIEVLGAIDTEISTWSEEVSGKLKQLAIDWEASMGDADESFYSLGIRRAEDVVLGITLGQRYPVLETKDTPDDF